MSQISAAILAGGRGRRMGGQDKGLLFRNAVPLVEAVLQQIAPQVDELMINANRNRARYARYGYPVHADVLPGFLGPLAGMLTGLEQMRHDYLVTVPCDGSELPARLVARLVNGLHSGKCTVAYAHDGMRAHPVYAILQRSCSAALRDYLAGGGRRLQEWMALNHAQPVLFPELATEIININEPADLCAATGGRAASGCRY